MKTSHFLKFRYGSFWLKWVLPWHCSVASYSLVLLLVVVQVFHWLAQQLSHRGCKKSSFTGLRFVCLQKESRLKYAWERKHFPSKDYIGSYRSEVSSSQNKWLTPSHWQREKSQSTEPCLDGWLADPVGLISSDILVDLATKQKKVSPCYFVVGALLSSQIKTSVHILSSLNYIHHFIRGPKTWVAGWHCRPESFCA